MSKQVKDLSSIFTTLREAPTVLEGLMQQIPPELYKQKRMPGKWTIHEHACHLAVVQDMILERFRLFREQEKPDFQAYMPGKNVSDAELIGMELNEALGAFRRKRVGLLELLAGYPEGVWDKRATHPRYKEFTPYIFLRHVMMHDHFHMYRIEELWLTQDEYLGK